MLIGLEILLVWIAVSVAAAFVIGPLLRRNALTTAVVQTRAPLRTARLSSAAR